MTTWTSIKETRDRDEYWLAVPIEEDAFGKGLLAKVSKSTIEEWAGDSQVSVEGETAPGKTMR